MTEHTNINALAFLCQEYQVDWLSDRIENYLLHVKITDTYRILEYIQFSEKMDLKENVVNNLYQQISDHFPVLQGSPLFALISRQIQMKIARKRLYGLMRFISIQNEVRNTLLCNYDNGLRYFFRDFFPKTQEEIKQMVTVKRN